MPLVGATPGAWVMRTIQRYKRAAQQFDDKGKQEGTASNGEETETEMNTSD